MTHKHDSNCSHLPMRTRQNFDAPESRVHPIIIVSVACAMFLVWAIVQITRAHDEQATKYAAEMKAGRKP